MSQRCHQQTRPCRIPIISSAITYSERRAPLESRMRSGASAYFIIIGYGALALRLIGGRLPGWFRSQFDTGLPLNPSIDVMCQNR